VVRTAGAFGGASRDGGMISDGGESAPSLLFCSLGGFVNVGPGGVGGEEMYPGREGAPFVRDLNTSPGAGASNTGREGSTILGSVASTSDSPGFPGRPGAVTRRGARAFTLDNATRERPTLSPLSFQLGESQGRGLPSVSLGGISLDGMPEEKPRGGKGPSRRSCSSSSKAPCLRRFAGE
jgi:hypothetical protein